MKAAAPPTTAQAVDTHKAMPLRASVKAALESYLGDVDAELVSDLYALVLAEVEAPMLEAVLAKVRYNQSKAAKMLGLNRGTLRTKLKQYDLLD
jgi:Fis family transcriptional regulator